MVATEYLFSSRHSVPSKVILAHSLLGRVLCINHITIGNQIAKKVAQWVGQRHNIWNCRTQVVDRRPCCASSVSHARSHVADTNGDRVLISWKFWKLNDRGTDAPSFKTIEQMARRLRCRKRCCLSFLKDVPRTKSGHMPQSPEHKSQNSDSHERVPCRFRNRCRTIRVVGEGAELGGTAPSQCCSKLKAKEDTVPSLAYTASVIVKLPVIESQPLLSKAIYSPGCPGVASKVHCALRYVPGSNGTPDSFVASKPLCCDGRVSKAWFCGSNVWIGDATQSSGEGTRSSTCRFHWEGAGVVGAGRNKSARTGGEEPVEVFADALTQLGCRHREADQDMLALLA
jgi:hypothetical protein